MTTQETVSVAAFALTVALSEADVAAAKIAFRANPTIRTQSNWYQAMNAVNRLLRRDTYFDA